MNQKKKQRTCVDEHCDNSFFQYKTTDKYCSSVCRLRNEKKKEKKEKKCAKDECVNTFIQHKTTDKYCSNACVPPKKIKKVLVEVKKQIKEKECNDKECNNVFIKYKSTDKYCSLTCEIKGLKSKVKVFEAFKSRQLFLKKKKSAIFEKKFNRSKNKIKKEVISEHGYLICEKCKTNNSIQFSTHHIVFRSEIPNHTELNNVRNLIHLCYSCHESFHKDKKSRNYLIKERVLTELFGNLWGYDKE